MKLIVKNSHFMVGCRGRRFAGLASVELMKGSLRILFLACLVVGGIASAHAQTSPVTSAGSRLTFAVADFDGDFRPDLADVGIGRSSVSLTDYWIRFRLSAAERQTILVVAPSGGLEIAARDVNGDHAIDLIVTTIWLRRPVAVLLNDGHGRFSRVDPAGFPEAFRECGLRWSSSAQQLPCGVLGSPPQSRCGIFFAAERAPSDWPRVAAVSLLSFGFVANALPSAHLGRAPPSEVTRL
jgi:hypothetical protein